MYTETSERDGKTGFMSRAQTTNIFPTHSLVGADLAKKIYIEQVCIAKQISGKARVAVAAFCALGEREGVENCAKKD